MEKKEEQYHVKKRVTSIERDTNDDFVDEEKVEKSKTKHSPKYSDEPLFTLTPKIMNAFFPLFMKYFLISALFCAILFGITRLLEFFDIFFLPISWSITFFVILAIILALIPLGSKIFKLAFTKYVFYETSVIKEFRFIIISKKSVIYTRITNVSLNITIWDRLCSAGDITLHTDDDEPDVVLQYIKNPEEIEHKIYNLIHRENKGAVEN